MGNSISSCCGAGDGMRCCCFSRSGGNMKSGKMVPADLHSSGAQGNAKNQKKQVVLSRPTTLPTGGVASTSTGQTQPRENNPKFEFSLHGVQKTSPCEQAEDSPGGQLHSSVQHKFLIENVSILFNEYKENDCDEILAEGISKFCNDLEVDPAEYIVLALAWKFKAATMCRFSREEFTQGCVALQADSIKSIQQTFSTLEDDARNNFKDIYKFAFQFGLDSEQGQRSLPSDVAVGMWQVVFSKNPPELLDEWLKFLEESKIRGISRDTWNMFLHFTENVGADLSNYDDNEAWPSLFDDFVEYYRTSATVKELHQKLENDECNTRHHEEENTPDNSQASSNEVLTGDALTQEHTGMNLPGVVPISHAEQVADNSVSKLAEVAELELTAESNGQIVTATSLVIENVIPESTIPTTSDSKQSEPMAIALKEPDIPLESGFEKDLTQEFEGEIGASRESLEEFPSTSEERSSEFDSEPIRCETLHSSHLT